MPDTPTAPGTPIPSAAGIVAVAGKEPLPIIIDLNRNGIVDINEAPVRQFFANVAYGLLGQVFKSAAQTKVLEQVKPHLEALAQVGAK